MEFSGFQLIGDGVLEMTNCFLTRTTLFFFVIAYFSRRCHNNNNTSLTKFQNARVATATDRFCESCLAFVVFTFPFNA